MVKLMVANEEKFRELLDAELAAARGTENEASVWRAVDVLKNHEWDAWFEAGVLFYQFLDYTHTFRSASPGSVPHVVGKLISAGVENGYIEEVSE